MEPKIIKHIKAESRMVVARGQRYRGRDIGEGNCGAHSSRYKMSKFKRCHLQHGDYN